MASDLDISTGRLFDSVMARPRKDSVMRRQKAKIIEETVLSRNIGVTSLVASLN